MAVSKDHENLHTPPNDTSERAHLKVEQAFQQLGAAPRNTEQVLFSRFPQTVQQSQMSRPVSSAKQKRQSTKRSIQCGSVQQIAEQVLKE